MKTHLHAFCAGLFFLLPLVNGCSGLESEPVAETPVTLANAGIRSEGFTPLAAPTPLASPAPLATPSATPSPTATPVATPTPVGTPTQNPSRAISCPLPLPAISDPYPWYPDLDLNRIPFHAGAGAWGPQMRIFAPAAPVTTRQVTVHTRADLAREGLIPGTQITIGSDIVGNTVLFGDVTDIDIIIPPGRRILGNVVVGSHTPISTTTRVRFRGLTPGVAGTGGLVGEIVFLSAISSNLIIDGIDLNGDDNAGGASLFYPAGTVDRMAVVNVRGHGVGLGSLHSGASNLVVAGSDFVTGARTRGQNGYPEGWGFRGGNVIVFFRNTIEGTRYHKIRIHPAVNETQYAWINENIFIDRYEARIVSAMNIGNTPPGTLVDGLWAQCNVIYAHSTCMTPSFDAEVAAYAQMTHNTFYGSFNQGMLEGQQNRHPSHNYLTGNAFNSWSEPPLYGSNPRHIPLPTDDPSDDNPALDQGWTCTAP